MLYLRQLNTINSNKYNIINIIQYNKQFDWRTDGILMGRSVHWSSQTLLTYRYLGFLAILFMVHPIFLRPFVHDTTYWSSEKFLSFYKEIMDAQHFPFYIIISNYVCSILFYQNKDQNVRRIRFHVCIKMRCCKRRVCKRKRLFGQPIYELIVLKLLNCASFESKR